MTVLLRACALGLWSAGAVSWVLAWAHWVPAGIVMTAALFAGLLTLEEPRGYAPPSGPRAQRNPSHRRSRFGRAQRT